METYVPQTSNHWNRVDSGTTRREVRGVASGISRFIEKILRAIFRALLNLLRRILAVIVALFSMLFLGLLAAITKGWHRLTDRSPKPPA